LQQETLLLQKLVQR